LRDILGVFDIGEMGLSLDQVQETLHPQMDLLEVLERRG